MPIYEPSKVLESGFSYVMGRGDRSEWHPLGVIFKDAKCYKFGYCLGYGALISVLLNHNRYFIAIFRTISFKRNHGGIEWARGF